MKKQKRLNLGLLLMILIFSACQKITKKDIEGTWITFFDGDDKPKISEITFLNKKVELIDDFLFKESGTYKLKNRDILINCNRDAFNIETKIQDLREDTLVVFDSLTFHRNEVALGTNIEEYELIGIPTNTFLPKGENYSHFIHFYKSHDGEIKIRFNHIAADYKDLPLFLENNHRPLNVLVFLGKGINLKDLKNLYYRLLLSNPHSLWLVTEKERLSGYHVFKDKIEIWRVDLENHVRQMKGVKTPLPPPRIERMSKTSYLKEGGIEIRIESRDDWIKLADLKIDVKYVVSISENISIKDYLDLKSKLKKENKEVVTEIE